MNEVMSCHYQWFIPMNKIKTACIYTSSSCLWESSERYKYDVLHHIDEVNKLIRNGTFLTIKIIWLREVRQRERKNLMVIESRGQ